jgi:predicted membrane-bound spermidine synthase
MPEALPPTRDPVLPAVFLVSMAVILLELGLTRLLSATLHYHFAFLAISLALFGSGAAGVAIYLAAGRIDRHPGGALGLAAPAAALGGVGVFWVVAAALFVAPGGESAGGEAARLAFLYACGAVPFFLLGGAVALAVVARAGTIARVYRADLLGAAAGCLLLVPLLDRLGGVNTLLVAPVLACLGAAGFARAAGKRPGPLVAAACAAAALVALNAATGFVDVRHAKGTIERDLLFARWNSFSRVTVARTGGPGLEIRIDADAATGISRNAGQSGNYPERRGSLGALAYRIKEQPEVLVIGPGGGDDVLLARLYGAAAVTAVEVNPIIARDIMSSEPFRSFSGDLFFRPGVRLLVDDARSYLRRPGDRYDVILGTMVDTWAATAAGAFALAENHLYTVEAFRDYAARLKDDGVLSLTRWYFEPPDQMLRLESLARAMMARAGIANPDWHVVVVRDRLSPEGRTPATLLFKKSRFTTDEVKTLEGFARMHDFAILYTPLTRPEGAFTDLMTASDPATVWDAWPTRIAPSTDDSPFFFNSLRPRDLLRAQPAASEWRKTNQGTVVLFVLFGAAALLVLLFVIGPLYAVRRRDLAGSAAGTLPWLAYFAALGAGFILIEVALLQRFILLVGPPVYALTVVLFTLLLGGGLGAGMTARLETERLRPALGLLLPAIAALVVLYAFGLPRAIDLLVPLERPARLGAAAALTLPLGILLGMPMPGGLRLLRAERPALLPWAWGLNGAASVTGSIGALVVAILSGFTAVLILGALAYLAARLCLRRATAG